MNESKDYYIAWNGYINDRTKTLFNANKSLDHRTWLKAVGFIGGLFAELFNVIDFDLSVSDLPLPDISVNRDNGIDISLSNGNKFVLIKIPRYSATFKYLSDERLESFTAGIFEDGDYEIKFSGVVSEPSQALFLLFYLL